MTIVGEVCGGRQIGYSGGRWMWLSCVDCGVTRWVMLKTGLPSSSRCRSCAARHLYKNHPNRTSGRNHPMYGKKHRPESIQKMRVSHIGQLVGEGNPFYGRKHTPETIEKLRLASTGKHPSAETRQKMAQSRKGKHHDPETIARLREVQRNRKPISDETRGKLRISHTGYKHTPEQTRKIVERTKGQKRTGTTVDRIRRVVRETWAAYSDDEKSERVAVQLRSVSRRPNGSERILLEKLHSVSSDWRYVGDGSLMISSRNPDYWNGAHKVIELFGDYWHKGDNPDDRVAFFAQFGYLCLVLWESEVLKDWNTARERVVSFSGVLA